MDHETFDRIVRLLGTPGSRRAALAALLGGSALGRVETALGKKSRKQRARNGSKAARNRRAKAQQAKPPAPQDVTVGAEVASCSSPGPSSNLNGCNFNGDDLDGFDLHSSTMKNTNFNGASLCGAQLYSSTLTNADFRNANLTKADLHSSGCNGIKTNAATRFCETIMCNGAVNNSDCPSGVNACCDVDDCEPRACFTVTCDQTSACDYDIQANGAPGTLCDAPRVCCNGNCCETGQKCCGSACIPNDQCCTNGAPGCPFGETCLSGGQTCCPSGQACGGSCLPFDCPGDSNCFDCNPETGTCDLICGPTLECCGINCKIPDGQPCTQTSECCAPPSSICAGEPKRCCRTEGVGCGSTAQCCPGLVCDDGECEEP